MGQKIVVGPLTKGLRNDVLAFNVDNESFPTLINAQQWRGRIRRKRGTTLLGRLTRYFDSTSSAYTGTIVNPSFTILFDGSGNANLIGPYTNETPISFSLQSTASIIPGSVTITGSIGPVVYTDPTMDGYLTPTGTNGPNTINYASGAIHIPAQAGGTATVQFKYFPNLPVLGLEDFVDATTQFPASIGFDTTYAYNINTTSPFAIWNISYYKNPATSGSYMQKAVWTPFTWNSDPTAYQQFFTTNYQGAMWATNGIEVPFDTTNIGMQYKPITVVTVMSGTTASLAIASHGLVIGDFVFINEVETTTGINFQTGYVTTVTDANNVIVTFPQATLATNGMGGIAQYLTNRSDPLKDCIRFYDGLPVSSATPPVFQTGKGWVNFCPPLISGPNNIFSIADLSPAQYYLVGCKFMVAFKDRLLFFGPVVQTSAAGSQRYLQDTLVYSQNGTPYYTCSFPYSTVTPTASVLAMTTFTPLLVPLNQTATCNAWFEDVTGYGGFTTAGIDQPIVDTANNEDVLLIGFYQKQTRLVYTSNDITPFQFFIINSELGSTSTFSAITLDRGKMDVGANGISLTAQTGTQRTDNEIPDEVFQFNLKDNGRERVCAQRDFINEWIYFTYSAAQSLDYFPNQSLVYNIRDGSWCIFEESYTTYGQFRRLSGQAWDDLTGFTWDAWNDPWDSGEQTLAQPEIIAGNQQGFILFKAEGTQEAPSGYIANIDSSSIVTSPHHNLDDGNYIVISGVIGTMGANVNGKIFSVASPTVNTFILNPTVGAGTYLGGGVFTRMYVPNIQTRQFPVSWDMARKTRIGVQQYLLTKTALGQITLQIFLSQNSSNPYNAGPIVPSEGSQNDALVYSQTLFTCPESTNLGLTPANASLMSLPPSQPQAQIWHRINTSLIGDTVQLGFTMSDMQMRDTGFNNQFAEIELHSFIIDVTPSQLLS